MGEGPIRDIGSDPLAEGSMDDEETPDSELESEEEPVEDEQ